MSTTRRLTFSLSSDTAMHLTAVSQRLGISRSGLVESLLSNACSDMIKVLDKMPTSTDGLSGAEAKRLRGESKVVLTARLGELQNHVNDL